MITAKIPAAIRKGSPVLWMLGPDSTVSGGVVHIHSDGSLSVASRQGGLLYEDDEVPRDAVELDISDPTGAAHLAWWLRGVVGSRTRSQHFDALQAIGSSRSAFMDVLQRAACGDTDPACLAILLNYTHHIAGVTNG